MTVATYSRIPTNAVTVTNDAGEAVQVPGTAEGHLEVEVHGPRLPFGSLHTENLTPVYQIDATYGINNGLVRATTSGTGTATASDSEFIVTTGTGAGGVGSIQSRKRLRYRAGQGSVGRFTMRFPSSVASSVLVAGLGHAEDGFFFGYNGTAFGILHSNRGVRETRTLTVAVASTHNENVTVTLNGTAYQVAVTNSGNTARTAYEISRGTFAGWQAQSVGSTVVFLRDSAGSANDTYSLSGTSASGTFARTKAGANPTDTWHPQTSWNGDRVDGTGPSGFTCDWTKFQVAQIGIQYLGAGVVSFEVETTSDANNPVWTRVHTLRFPGTLTASIVGNPSFPFTMAAYSAGSTTNVSVESICFAGFTEGRKETHGNRFSYINNKTSSTSVFVPLFTVQNLLYYAGRSNQGVVNLLSVSGSSKGANSHTTFYLLKNATLSAGNPSFSQYATNSMTAVDTAATECTFATNDQIVWTGQVVDGGNLPITFEDNITIQPGESLTLAVRSVTATATCVGSLNTREDQ